MGSLIKKLGLGRLAYHFYHRPIAVVGDSIRAGGPLEQWRTERGRRQMEAAARNLLPFPAAGIGEAAVEVHVLTGRRFWYQAAFCLWTLAKQTRRAIAPVVYDDGSLTTEWRELLARVVPGTRFVGIAETVDRLDTHLPAARFPTLRRRWSAYPQLRKLTDIHVGQTGWKLSIDSDLLFFGFPRLLLDWVDRPSNPLHATDVQNAYGYTLETLADLAGRPVQERVNTGLCGLCSDEIDWDRMENWSRTLIERAGTSYYEEQALVALLLAGRECTIAPIADYVTFPKPPEVHECRAIMHHYVADSKRWYFRDNWRHAQTAP